jgi:hypothetical protein
MPANRSRPVSVALLYPRLPTPNCPRHANGSQPPLHSASDGAAGTRVGHHPPPIGPADGSPAVDESGRVGVALVSWKWKGGRA